MFSQTTLKNIEFIIDIIWCVEILLSFIKWSKTKNDFKTIAQNYIFSYFIFDILATIPGIVYKECWAYYPFKLFRVFYIHRLTEPLMLLKSCY
jgi:hypothetical protein